MLPIEQQIAHLADAVAQQLGPPDSVGQPARGPRRRRLVSAAAGLLVLGGVGAVALVVGRGATSGTGSPDLTPQEVAEMREDLDRQLPTASVGQQAALEDGVVTVTEILGLAQEASDCSVAAGGPVIMFEWNGKGVERTINLGSDESRTDEMVSISDQCWHEHLGLAEIYIGLQQVAPVEEQQRLRKLTVQCLLDAGIDAPTWPATDVEIDPSIEATCVDQAEAYPD